MGHGSNFPVRLALKVKINKQTNRPGGEYLHSGGRALLSRFNGEQLQVNKGVWSGTERFVKDDDEESEYSVLPPVAIVFFSFLGLIPQLFILEAFLSARGSHF